MRADVLALGVFFLMLGFIVFMLSYDKVQEYETWAGRLARTLSPNEERQYQTYKMLTIIGGIMAIAGFSLTIYGAAAQPEKEKT